MIFVKIAPREDNPMVEGLKGVVSMMDDILVYGSIQAEHDSYLISVLDQIKASGTTLNEDKCQFSKKSIKFLGCGICPDPDKVRAIIEMKSLRQFLGMVHQMSKFSPHLVDKANHFEIL